MRPPSPAPDRRPASGESGQAMVESALTLPVTVFVILGTLQLFLMLNARIMAEVAVYRATRAGSVNGADCRVMTDSAIAVLLPTFARTDDAARLVRAWTEHSTNNFSPVSDFTSDRLPRIGSIVWLQRRLDRNVGAAIVDTFDDRYRGDSRAEIQVDLVFWFPLTIPFADWVMARSFLAMFGGMPYLSSSSPLMPTAKATWTKKSDHLDGTNTLDQMRFRIIRGQYDFPIRTSYRMRMMTPAVHRTQPCPGSPEDGL